MEDIYIIKYLKRVKHNEFIIQVKMFNEHSEAKAFSDIISKQKEPDVFYSGLIYHFAYESHAQLIDLFNRINFNADEQFIIPRITIKPIKIITKKAKPVEKFPKSDYLIPGIKFIKPSDCKKPKLSAKEKMILRMLTNQPIT